MYPCPHCHAKSFGFASKWLSSPVFPAACALCGKLSRVPGTPGGALLVLNTLLLTGAGLAAAALRSPLPLAAGAVLAAAIWLRRVHAQPLIGLTPQQVSQARKAEGLGWLLLVVAVFAR